MNSFLLNLHGIAAKIEVSLGGIEQILCLDSHAESVVEESFVDFGVNIPRSICQTRVVVPTAGHKLRIDVEPDVKGKLYCVLPLEHEYRGIHLHRLTIYRQCEPLLHHADIHFGLPNAYLEFPPTKAWK